MGYTWNMQYHTVFDHDHEDDDNILLVVTMIMKMLEHVARANHSRRNARIANARSKHGG